MSKTGNSVTPTLDHILTVTHAKSTGQGWIAHCPAHDDRTPSLQIREGERGLLLKCWAGCSLQSICDALGIEQRELFFDHDTIRPAREAATRAERIWSQAPPAPADHPYLQKKQVQPHSLRRHHDGRLIVPIYREGTLSSLQFIDKDGKKKYLKGGVKKGGSFVIGDLTHETKLILTSEGVATGFSLYEATGLPTVIAFDAPNLLPVAESLRRQYPHVRIVICGDHDGNGVGQRRAREAAEAVNGLMVIPDPEGTDWNDLHRQHGLDVVKAAIDIAMTTSACNGSQGLPLTSLRELLSEPEEDTPYLVEPCLPVGGLSMVFGKPKDGKSTLVRNLAVSVARGQAWLGMPTTQGTVFYLALEEKRAQVRKHFRMMGADGSERIFIFCAPSPADGLAQLRAATERDKPALIIVDPLFRFTRVRDCNDYAAVTSALEPLLTLARETNAHVLAVHHLGKGKRDGGDAILGSTAIFASVDTALLLKRTEKFRTLRSIQRYGEDLEEVTLNMDTTTGLISVGSSRKEAEEDAVAGLIFDYLATQTEPIEEPLIHEHVEARKGVKVKALRRLVEQGNVNRQGEGKKGNPYTYSKAGFLVPYLSLKPENQNRNNERGPQQSEAYSGSRLCVGSETTPEPVSEEIISDET